MPDPLMCARYAPDRDIMIVARLVAKYSLLMTLALGCGQAAAETRDVAADGFLSTHTMNIAAPSAVVFKALTRDVSRWWNAEHSYSGEARNFRLPARAGECFCERLPGGGSVEHMRVVFAKPGSELRLAGGLGPLQTMGVAGSMVFRLEEQDDGNSTVLHYSYRVTGAAASKLDMLAGPVDAVQKDQLQRLKHWVEKRNPNWPALNRPDTN